MASAPSEGRVMGQRTIPDEFWTLAGTVHGPLSAQDTAQMVEYEEAMIADPLPLGMAALASATFTVSAVYAGWFRFSDIALAIPLMFIFGGVTQFLAGMWAFRRGNVLEATAFCTIGAFYASWAITRWLAEVHVFPALLHHSDPSLVNGVFILTYPL
jgi:succinate-acetate transporter protein